MNAPLKWLLLSALLIEPLASKAQTPIIEFRITEKTGTSVANTGSLGGTGSVVGALGSAGASDLAGDYSFNDTVVTMGGTGSTPTTATTGGITASVSALSTSRKSITLQGWFKSDTVIAGGARLLDNYSAATAKGFGLRGPAAGENAGALYLSVDGQTVNSGANSYSNINGWVFFAVTYDGSVVKFFKGTTATAVAQVGASQAFGVNVGLVDALTSTLMVGNSGNIRPYKGYLDNIRIYADSSTVAAALNIDQLDLLRRGDVYNALMTTSAIAVNAGSMIRNDIGRETFGGGVDMRNPQFKDVMAASPSAATRTMFQNMNMGTMRFPQGTCALFYYWGNAPASYIDHGDPLADPPIPDPFPGLTGPMLITPQQMYAYTDKNPAVTTSLHMDKLLQVNTFSYVVNNWDYKYVNVNKTKGELIADIVPDNLTGAATYAASWVANNLPNATNRATYWEIGNEDWVWWTPAQYAQIFNAFAVKMKEQAALLNIPIKLLAQTTTGTNVGAGGIINTPDWTNQMISTMNANLWSLNNVYALSEHQYLNGNATGKLPDNVTNIACDFSNYPASPEGQRALLQENMFAKVEANSRLIFLKQQIALPAPSWKIWMTEFNVVQNDATTTASAPNGVMKRLHDLGHGLVIVDWVGKMLESNVERILIHSFDHHPFYSVVDYVNGGGSISAPIKTVPGYAFGIFPEQFGNKMVNNSVTNNTNFNSHNEGPYKQVSVYSSINDSDNTLRVIVVNRSANKGVRISLSCSGRTIAASPAQYTSRELYSLNLLDSNYNAIDTVKWSAPVSKPIPGSVIDGIVLKEHSANLFIIPLVP